MEQIIKKFNDNSYLEYSQGNFDKWCVYYINSKGKRTPLKDTDYFVKLKEYANKYGVDRIYNDYVKIYNQTNKEIDKLTLELITKISNEYQNDSLEIDIMFTTLYMTMISEENKENTLLGKRIKRLGIHMLLKENYPVEKSANFMRGMKWYKISDLCKERGF